MQLPSEFHIGAIRKRGSGFFGDKCFAATGDILAQFRGQVHSHALGQVRTDCIDLAETDTDTTLRRQFVPGLLVEMSHATMNLQRRIEFLVHVIEQGDEIVGKGPDKKNGAETFQRRNGKFLRIENTKQAVLQRKKIRIYLFSSALQAGEAAGIFQYRNLTGDWFWHARWCT